MERRLIIGPKGAIVQIIQSERTDFCDADPERYKRLYFSDQWHLLVQWPKWTCLILSAIMLPQLVILLNKKLRKCIYKEATPFGLRISPNECSDPESVQMRVEALERKTQALKLTLDQSIRGLQ